MMNSSCKMRFGFCFVLFVLALCTELSAQCTVSLGSNVTICSGASTTLTATVTGNTGAVNYAWSALPPPAPIGNTPTVTVTPGAQTTYIVTVNGGGCTDVKDTIIVHVSPNPVANFTVNNNGVCSGTVVNFTNSSTGAASYSWSFGDPGSGAANASTLTNPSHTYTTPIGHLNSTYTVTLTATNSAGCVGSKQLPVTIKQAPNASLFDIDNTPQFTFCGGGGSVTLNVQNDSNDTLSDTNYTIYWGDSDSTSMPNFFTASHIYTSPGYFSLILKVTGQNGCMTRDTYSVYNGSNPEIGLGIPPGTIGLCAPDSLTFPIDYFQDNTDGTMYTVTVNDTSTPVSFSHPPPTSYTHTFTQTSCNVNSPNYQNAYNVRIKAENQCSSSSGTVQPITVNAPPQADFTISPDPACINRPVTITNTSDPGAFIENNFNCDATPIFNWIITPVTSGTYSVVPANGLGQNPPTVNSSSTWGKSPLTVTFHDTGTYNIKLKIRNRSNCGTDSIQKQICIHPEPVANFTFTQSAECILPSTVQFTNQSNTQNSCGNTSYYWTVDDNTSDCATSDTGTFINSTRTSINPQIRFDSPGVYTVTLRVTNGCGSTTFSQVITVKAKPRVSINTPAPLCSAQSVTLSADVLDCEGTLGPYAWSFPAGAVPSTSSAINPTVNFSSTGNITLTVGNECGSTTATATVTVLPPPIADAGADQSVCSSNATTTIGGLPQAGYSYSWLPTAGLGNPNVSNPTVTLTNTGTHTFTVTVLAGNCSATDEVNVLVDPAATVNAGPPQTVCTGNSVMLSGTIGGSATSASWSSTQGTFLDSNSLTTQFTPTGNATVTLTTDDPAGPCPAVDTTVIITVISNPGITNNPLSQTVCSGQPTAEVIWTSNGGSGTTYSWSGSSASGVTGFPTPGTGNLPPFTPINTGTTPGTIIYSVTPTVAGCQGTAATYTITVNPLPVLDPLGTQTICSGGSFLPVPLTANIPGTTFSWTTDATGGISEPPGDNGSTIPGDSLNNPGTAPGTVTYTVTPELNGCAGQPELFIVTVNPSPGVVSSILPQSICSGETSWQVNLSSATPGVTITWESTLPAGVTGGHLDSGMTVIPPQELNNDTTLPITVTYTATAAITGSATCSGSTFDYTITVNPIPMASASPVIDTICSGDTLNVTLSSNVAISSFSWSVTVSDTNYISGASASSGSTINQSIGNSSSQIQTVTYSITPIANGCGGNPIILTVDVNPAPTVIFSDPDAGQSICTGESSTSVTLTSSTTNATITWTASNPGSVVGVNPPNGTDIIPVQVLTNNTPAPLTVTYSARAFFMGCLGPTAEYNITVNPLPVVNAGADITLCNQPIPHTLQGYSPTTDGTGIWSCDSNVTPGGEFTPSGLGTVTLCYTFTDTNFCVNEDSIEIEITDPTFASAGPADTFCLNHDTVVLQGYTPAGGIFSGPGIVDSLAGLFHPAPAGSGVKYITYTYGAGTCETSDNTFYYIRPLPQPDFTYTETCIGEPTMFTDVSIAVEGTITSWNWNFGDNNNTTSIDQHPTHTYIAPDEYFATLTINNSEGCTNDTTIPVVIHPLPTVTFTHPLVGCIDSVVQFTLTAVDADEYEWDFGDGGTATGSNPTHVYTSPEIYTVRLNATTEFNCVDTSSSVITIAEYPVADFVASPDSGCGPLTVTIHYLPQTTGSGFDFTWDLGNGDIVHTMIPGEVIYDPPSFNADTTYIITAWVQNQVCQQIDIHRDTIRVYGLPRIALIPDKTDGCGPLTVTLENQSKGYDSLAVDFGDGHSTVLYDAVAEVSHEFQNETDDDITFIIRYTAFNGCGISRDSLRIVVFPNTVEASVAITPAAACMFEEFILTNNSTGATYVYYDAGSGSSNPIFISDTSSLVRFSFGVPGDYVIHQHIFSGDSCSYDHDSVRITVYPSPSSDFEAEQTGFECAGPVEITFTNTTTGAVSYSWDFADSTYSIEVSPQHIYDTTGTYLVSLSTESEHGCKHDTVKPVIVKHRDNGLRVPNALSPEYGEPLVRVFKPTAVCLATYTLRIFNTWGELVWESDKLEDGQPAEGWDGRHKDTGKLLPQDVYMWKIEATYQDKEKWQGKEYDSGVVKKIGTVTLVL